MTYIWPIYELYDLEYRQTNKETPKSQIEIIQFLEQNLVHL